MSRRPPEIPLPPRRRRLLSDAERMLWETVVEQITPLRRKPKVLQPGPIERPSVEARHMASDKPLPVLRVPEKPKQSALPPLATIDRRERAKLSRGKRQIDARIDLHGMTQSRAHRALHLFLQRASGEGLSFVLVITGKGRSGSDTDRGVLRRQVPQWLALPEFRSLIVGFDEAHIGHGGEGALYVRIRRSRG